MHVLCIRFFSLLSKFATKPHRFRKLPALLARQPGRVGYRPFGRHRLRTFSRVNERRGRVKVMSRVGVVLTGLFLFALPVELAVFHDLHEPVLLLEIHGQVRRQDGVLHQLHHGAVVLRRQRLEYVVAVAVQDHHALVEVMVFHRAGRVEYGQRRFGLRLERVVRAPVVEIVTQARHQQPQDLYKE